ncbi:Uncharacterised protein [Mycobacteroides abscessus subsp. abscessus]|nr:Uncharacterised protein [Mycobacteroides abscessus subsp. abscessus]
MNTRPPGAVNAAVLRIAPVRSGATCNTLNARTTSNASSGTLCPAGSATISSAAKRTKSSPSDSACC